jgi:putative hydrolase of the HAD superfamily
MIKAVIFDLGGVLVDNPAPAMFDHYSKTINVPKEDLLEIYSKYETDWQKGTLSEDEFWTKITADLNVTKPELESLWLDGFLSAYKEKAEMFSLIKNLKKNGYKVALLSNTETPVMNHIKKLSWPDFDLFVYSCEVGMRKPDREIYENTLASLSIKPEEAVFIDDKPENVESAKKVGMQSFVFENPEQVIKNLQNMGLSV